MRVLWTTDKGYPVMGGAQVTNLAFLKNLSEKFAHDCHIFCSYPRKKRIRFGHVKLATFRDIHELKGLVLGLRPDIIISSPDVGVHVQRIADLYNIPTVHYLQSYEYAPPDRAERESWKVSLSRDYSDKSEADFIFRESDACVVNSLYMKRRFEKKYGRKFLVIYPELIEEDFLVGGGTERKEKYITGICGFPYKGADIFYELAKRMSHEKFLLAGNSLYEYHRKFEKLGNVRILPYTRAKKFLGMSKAVLVPSQWPEPFGRIVVEAAANGIPTLASLTGGITEIVRGTPLGVKNYKDPGSWEKKLRNILESETARSRNSSQGIRASRRFLKGRSSRELDGLIKKLVRRKKPDYNVKSVVALSGRKKEKTAYSSVNSMWLSLFENKSKYITLDLESPSDFRELPIDFFIHHDYQQDFGSVSVPREGKFIAVRTWDFGMFPGKWVGKIDECDQLWVHSGWVKRNAMKSGVDKKRIKVIPHGIDEKIFKPAGEKYGLSTDKSFKFLFVGATVFRKGIDILLKAFGMAFSAEDDVCLVIKDNPRDVFYSGIKYKDEISALRKDKNYPELIYIDEYLSTRELASLYRVCDVGVFSYRAEGFCLPILEAMASGLPSIVPRFGACLDFCADSNSFLMPVKRFNMPVLGSFAINTLGFSEEVEEVDFCEVSPETLAGFMRKIYNTDRRIIEKKSLDGIKKAHERFRWSHVLSLMKLCLGELESREVPRRLKRTRAENFKSRRKFETAKEIFLNLKPRN
ncbi:MAG: glycosyltransferase family 4 protein [Thermodesulfobacteriota bacterium]